MRKEHKSGGGRGRKKLSDTRKAVTEPSSTPSLVMRERHYSSPAGTGAPWKSDKLPDIRQDEFKEGQSVELLISDRTDIGYKAIINGSREGLLYKNEVFRTLRKGQQIGGFIKKMREDGRIDLCLQKPGPEKVAELSEIILEKLKAHEGFIAVDDKSPPEVIYRLFGVSKKTYKKAIGSLYRERLIIIESSGIRLAGKGVI